MHKTLLVMAVLFLGSMASAQIGASVAAPPANGPSYTYGGNSQHADQHDLRPEVSLLGNNSVTEAHGEQPLWQFGSDKVEPSLGDIARAYRKEKALCHEVPALVFEKQGQ